MKRYDATKAGLLAQVGRLNACYRADLAALARLFAAMRSPRYDGDIGALVLRVRLVRMVISAHDSDLERMHGWASAVIRNGEKRR